MPVSRMPGACCLASACSVFAEEATHTTTDFSGLNANGKRQSASPVSLVALTAASSGAEGSPEMTTNVSSTVSCGGPG